jgi:hypothetical protein
MKKEKLALIKVMDECLCSPDGMSDNAYTVAYAALEDDDEIVDILEAVEATDGRFYFPECHVGIENMLRVDVGSRHEQDEQPSEG